MTVKRQYFRLGKVTEVSQKWWNENQQDLAPVSGNTLTLGETYLVKIHVGTDAARQQVALESYLASGLKLINPRFLTEATAVGYDQGYNWPFYHQELRADRFFASATRVDQKTWGDGKEHEITYVVRAQVPGTFMEPPVSVYPMYQPEVEAHTAFRELVIEE